MLPADDRFDAWFTNRVDEIAAWQRLMHRPVGEVAPSQVYIGVTGSGKTHLRRRFEQISRSAGVPSVTIELDRVKEGRDTVDVAMLAHRMIVALNIDAPRTTLALLRIASMESGDPVQENAMMSELGSAALSTGFDAIISKLSTISITGIATVLLKQAYEKIKRDKQALQIYLRTEEGDADRTWTLSQIDSAAVRRDVFRRLAEDIADNPRRPENSVQVALFLDSGEHGGEEMPWLDRLLHAMSANGAPMLVAAIFGQTNVTTTMPADRLVRNYLEGFLRDDAVAYCTDKRGLSVAVTEGLLPEAREDADEERYHVYSLGLLCDAALDHRGPLALLDEDLHYPRPVALSRRFLRRLELHEQGFLRRLALVPTFDEDAACHACDVGPDAERRAALMKWLRSFSFVQSAGVGLWRLHAVMRRVLAETSSDEDNLRRHQEWLEYWASRTESAMDDAAARSWYHLFALGLEAAMEKWNAAAGSALQSMRTDEHAWLVDLARPLIESDPTGGARATPAARASARNDWATETGQATRGDLRSRLEEAVDAYRVNLEVCVRAGLQAAWAGTQLNLGSALWSLGVREVGTERLQEAVDAFRAALEVHTRQSSPTQWAMIQNNLGNALVALGEREVGTERLQEAVDAFRAALEVCTRENARAAWAMIQNNLGTALMPLSEREAGTDRLEDAVEAYHAVLEVYTRDASPADWAMTQNNLGLALRSLGEREAGTERLEGAVVAYRSALEVRTREASPDDWATTQNNLGLALRSIGERVTGTDRLVEAVEAYRAALKVRSREDSPAGWAMLQNNFGTALKSLGEREPGTERLEESVAAYRAALVVHTREASPTQWAMTQNNLGVALKCLGERGVGTERLEEAVEAYQAALEVYTREASPYHYEVINSNRNQALQVIEERTRPTGG